ncbi:hypothetical protein H1R20_g3426, partial [Candolleomyces eurysporus]
MADALASTSTAGSSSSPIELVQRALSANQALQYELTKRAEQLQAEIREADRLLESPFRAEATKRSEFASRITAQSFNPKQLEALKNAIRSENQRLQACNTQAGNQRVIDIDRNTEGVNWSVVAERVSDAGSDKFTADQCRIKWVGDRHPRFNRSEWKAPETQKLSAFVEAAMTSTERLSWVEITQKLGTNRTVVDVLNRGCIRQRHQWDSQSDEQLLQAVDKYGVNNWTIVAREVSKYVTPTQCQNRYNKSLDPNIKRGAWTGVEDERLKKAVAAFGSAWVRNSNASKNVWADEEDKMLLELVNSNGRQWKSISEKIGNGKTGPSCRIRFNKLTKVKEGTPASSSIPGTPSMPALSPAPGTPGDTDRHTSDSQSQAGASTAASDPSQTKRRGKKRKPDSESADGPAPKKKRTAAQLGEEMDTRPNNNDATASTSTAKLRPKPRPIAKRKGKAVEQAQQTSAEQDTTPNASGSETAPVPTMQGEPAAAEEMPQGRRRSARRSTRSEVKP